MKKDMKTSYCLPGVFTALFLILILLVRTVDVAQVGPQDTSIGLSHINVAIHNFFGINMIWYKLTEVFGGVALLIAGGFAVFGGVQLVGRKSIAKVDKEIIALGGLYAVVLVFYAFFEKVIINYRPIIEEGADEVEASFPSSHTMLICVIMGSLIIVLDKYVKNASAKRVITIISAAVIVLTVVGRLICGVHWFTDILGGIFISLALLSIFASVINAINEQ